jgi:hypothetical protein
MTPGNPDDEMFRASTLQQFHSQEFDIFGVYADASEDGGIVLPYLNKYYVFNEIDGDWICYHACASGNSSYVNIDYLAVMFFVGKVREPSGRLPGFTVAAEEHTNDDPQHSTNRPPGFVGPVANEHGYEQGAADAFLTTPGGCPDTASDPDVWMTSCYAANGNGRYYHAPQFYVDSSVAMDDGISLEAGGAGNFSWSWDGIPW